MTENSAAMVFPELENGGIPQKADELGLKYFIEVLIAYEFLTSWAENLDKAPTAREKCIRLIQYAIDDAWTLPDFPILIKWSAGLIMPPIFEGGLWLFYKERQNE